MISPLPNDDDSLDLKVTAHKSRNPLTAGTRMVANASEPVFFWRPHEENGYLGQWFASPFTTPSPINSDETVTFQNCETYMMYHKAILFNDISVAKQILLAANDPKEVKALGRKVRGFNEAKWGEKKFEIVVAANREKFGQHVHLKEQLLKTEGREIIEASPMDKIWGIGFGKENALKNRYRWGKNLLGKALMQVRDEYIADQEKERK
jgi:ribA/ribD-fused uncharacterized protein